MKNKEAYDLTKLIFMPKYQTDGCGKKIPKPFFMDIKYNDTLVAINRTVNEDMLVFIFRWLEDEKE